MATHPPTPQCRCIPCCLLFALAWVRPFTAVRHAGCGGLTDYRAGYRPRPALPRRGVRKYEETSEPRRRRLSCDLLCGHRPLGWLLGRETTFQEEATAPTQGAELFTGRAP